MAVNLSLDGIIDVNLTVSPVSSLVTGFDSLLLLTNSTVISAEERTKSYSSIAEVLVDFNSGTDEYAAAALYFSQSSNPRRLVIGVMAGDETMVDAINLCRQSDEDWYVVSPTTAIISNIEVATISTTLTQVATYVEAMDPPGILALSLFNIGEDTTYDTVAQALKAGNYRKTINQYTSNDNVEDIVKTPVCGIMGYALGYNQPTNMAYTLAYKTVNGIQSEKNITSAYLNTIINDYNSNVYIYQGKHDLFRQGRMCDGTPFDEVIFLDQIIAEIKNAAINQLKGPSKVPQTQAGLDQFEAAFVGVLEPFVVRQFLAPGVWNGPTVLNLSPGDTMSTGYLIQFTPLEEQSQADRENRKAPNCYISLKLAGAIEHLTIGIYVDR